MDLDAFLDLPLVARVATHGPRVRPVWFLWEEGCLWWLTGPNSALRHQVLADPAVAVVIDTCDLESGVVEQVNMTGPATIQPYDQARATRKLRRYLGPDVDGWDPRFDPAQMESGTAFIRLVPDAIRHRDFSFTPASSPTRHAGT